MHTDRCPCLACITRARFAKCKRKPTYPIMAYLLFVEMVTYMLLERRRQINVDVSQVITCKEILDKVASFGQDSMGSLAAVVFELLGLRHSKDLHYLSEELVEIEMIPGHISKERFSDYDVDLLKALREPSTT